MDSIFRRYTICVPYLPIILLQTHKEARSLARSLAHSVSFDPIKAKIGRIFTTQSSFEFCYKLRF